MKTISQMRSENVPASPDAKSKRGRKSKQDSRSDEIRARLVGWKQTPNSMRPSLRSLARELGTSHQLLSHYLERLHVFQSQEYFGRSKEIHARAEVEGRPLTPLEEQQANAYGQA